MGLCGSSLTPAEAQALKDEKARAAAIEKDMQRDRKKDQQVHKLLLLGAGESGKSTLFKQLIVLYSGGFSDKDRMAYLPVICNNMIGAMKTLLEQSDRQGSPAQIAPELQSVKAEVLEMKIPDIIDKELAVKVKSLWADPGIQYTYSKRSTFQLIDAASFFFDHVDRYSQPHYVPLEEDVLRCRVRTTGIVENTFIINDNNFKVIDVGGQRNERKKWIHCFQDVTAVCFVVALSEYDQMLFEDETTNRMDEAVRLFEEVCNSQWFRKTSMILFLNKRDLFAEKIVKTPLTVWDAQYDGPNTYNDGIDYIQHKFLSQNHDHHKQVYVHVTCATDGNMMRAVFNIVQDIVIRAGLAETGMI